MEKSVRICGCRKAICIFQQRKTSRNYSKMITEVGKAARISATAARAGPAILPLLIRIPLSLACNSVEEFLDMDARIVTLNPMTIMQNSLHGVFGCSGDIANVPPRAATIGPADIKRARNRLESHGLTTHGTFSSWQRMISRLILHGEVTPQVPASILQL